MAVIAFDPTQIRKYSLKQDKAPPEERTWFHIGVLNARITAFINDSLTGFSVTPSRGANGSADARVNVKERNLAAVRYGIKGWENFPDTKGLEIRFMQKLHNLPIGQVMGLTDECLDFLKPYIDELASEVLSDNVFTEEDEKNLKAP